MILLLRKIFPSLYSAIWNEGFAEACKLYEREKSNHAKRHPRAADGKFCNK